MLLTPSTYNKTPLAAFMAIPETILDPCWYADGGTTNHVAATLDNTIMKTEYGGQEKLTIGNGKQLSISHIGLAYLPTHFSVSFRLENVLHVPQITKNLVSISQLIVDNRVFVEFHANCCLMKDKTMGTILLRGKLRDGLYLLYDPRTTTNSQ